MFLDIPLGKQKIWKTLQRTKCYEEVLLFLPFSNEITYTLKCNVPTRPFEVLTSPSADRHSGTLNRAHGKPSAKAKGKQAKESGRQKHLEDISLRNRKACL